MSSSEMIWKYCNLKNREASFRTTPGIQIEDKNIISEHFVECLDMEYSCISLKCKFAQGDTDPFVMI